MVTLGCTLPHPPPSPWTKHFLLGLFPSPWGPSAIAGFIIADSLDLSTSLGPNQSYAPLPFLELGFLVCKSGVSRFVCSKGEIVNIFTFARPYGLCHYCIAVISVKTAMDNVQARGRD